MATTITVPSGSGGASVSLTFATAATASLATNLLAAVYKAGAALNAGPSTIGGAVNEFVIAATATGSVTVPAGFNYIVDAATGPVTIVGNNGTGETFVATSAASITPGGGFLLQNFGTGTVIAGSGDDTIQSSSTVAGALTELGDATYHTFGTSGTFATTGTGVFSGNVTVTGTSALVFTTGSNASITNTGGADTFVAAGGGATTINAGASGGLYFDFAGTSLTFINSGASTVVSGVNTTAFGGAGNSFYIQPTGNVTLLNGASNSSVFAGTGSASLFDSAGGQVNLFGTSNGNILVAGAGAETLAAPFATGNNNFFGGSGADLIYMGIVGNDQFFAGSGSATIVGSTTASDLFAFINGDTGGTDTIFNFTTADTISLSGYGTAAETAAVAAQKLITGGLQLVLPDKTVIVLAGISSLSTSQVKIA